MDEPTRQIREIAKELFDNDEIDLFIGFSQGSVPMRSRPFFISAKDEHRDEKINTLIWDSFCANNLAAYLPKYFQTNPHKRPNQQSPKKPRIAVTVKGCDMRSMISLLKEKQVPRDHMHFIGVPCQGMVDTGKIEEALRGFEIGRITEPDDDTLLIETKSGKKKTLNREHYLQDCCLECRFPMPEQTDHLIEGQARKPGDGGYARIQEFQTKPIEERWEYFRREMEKCIRCNACRQACPNCYCKECFAEEIDLKWIGATTDLSDTMLFHIIRIFHQAGRCVECDACYRACPMNVDLRMFTKKMFMDVEALFEYVTDFDGESSPPLSTFKEEDPEQFITDPESK